MPALVAYLTAICIFLGGGYAGLLWLATADGPPVHVSKAAPKPSKAEAAAPVIPATEQTAPVPQPVPRATAKAAERKPAEQAKADPELSGAAPMPAADAELAAPSDKRLDARAEAVSGDRPVQATDPASVSAIPAAKPETPATKKPAARATKPRTASRVASRAPVRMILRTIEFPDGRREQVLVPMKGMRHAGRFADDDDD